MKAEATCSGKGRFDWLLEVPTDPGCSLILGKDLIFHSNRFLRTIVYR